MSLVLKRHHTYTVTIDDQAIRLLLKRMTVEQYDAFNAVFIARGKGRADEDAQASAAWLRDVFEQYVSVVPGDLAIEGEDGQLETVTSGGQFADLFGGHTAMLTGEVLFQLWAQNSLTEKQKKTLQSRFDSETGSLIASSPEASGPRPETAVTDAEPKASAAPEAATAPSSDVSSGMTDPFDSGPVPSES